MIKQQLLLDGASYSIYLPDAERDYIQGRIVKDQQPYELEMLRDMAARLQPGDLVLDVGANIGNHTLYLASVAGCRVHAFEPNKHLCDALMRSAELNGQGDRVVVHQVGVAANEGVARFSHLDPANLGAQSLEQVQDADEDSIQLVSLDQMQWPYPVRMIKIDVEGMEGDVIKGAQQLIQRDKPILYVESQTAEDFELLSSQLNALGYLYCATFNATPTHVFQHENFISMSDDVPLLLAEKARQLYAFKKETAELRSNLQDCNLKYRETNERIKRLAEQRDQASAKYREASSHIDLLKLNIEKQQLRIKELEFEEQKLSVSQSLEAERAVLQLEREKAAHEMGLERWANHKEFAEREISGLREQLAQHERQVDLLQVELARRSELLNQANEKYLHVTGHQVPQLKEELAEQASYVAELQQRMAQQEQQHAQVRTRLEADARALEELLQSVQGEREELARHYRDVQQELSARIEELNQLNQHHLATSQTVPQLEEALVGAHERISELRALLKEQEHQAQANAEIVKSVHSLKENLQNVLNEKIKLESRLQTAQQQLDSANFKYRQATGQEIPQLKQKLSEQVERTRVLQERAEKLNGELKQARQAKADAQRALSSLRSSLAYKAGLHLRAASVSFRDALKLPVRLWRLRQQVRPGRDVPRQAELLSPPTANDHGDLRTDVLAYEPNNQVRMACIMDDFTFGSYQSECQLLQLTPGNWSAELEAFQPEVLFIESAWRGKDELWGSKVGHCSQELQGIVAWCRERHIPTLFWNKEDPVHFETFLTTAQLFDFVFTTDMDCIHRYKAALGHEHVYFLPFACQPAVHNPIEKYARKDAFCFAGAYYVRYPERTRDLESFVRELPAYRPLEIYDRNYGKNDPNYQFPVEYQPHIVGTLPFTEIDKAYKGYRYAINLNSIKQSQTMFARRVYELLGSNTLTISNYSRGVRLMFGDLVVTSDSGNEIRRRLEQLEVDSTVDRLRLAGLRKAMSEHTYADRLNYILEKITGQPRARQLPAFTVIAMANDQHEALATITNAQRQQGVELELLLVCGNSLKEATAQALLESSSLKGRAVSGRTLREQHLQELAGDQRWVCGMHAADYYGAHYLLDMALATRYSAAQVIGKAAYYSADGQGAAVLNNAGSAYHTGQFLAARRAVIHPAFAQTQNAREWLQALADLKYSVVDQLAIDSFNYCEGAGSDAASGITAQIDDVAVNQGISLADLDAMAEGIAPMQSDLEHAPWLDGAQLAHALLGEPFTWLNGHGLAASKDEERSVKLTRNEAISARLIGPLLEVDSKLPDGKHEYLYAAKNLPLLSLQEQLRAEKDQRIPLHLQIDPGLNLSLVVLYLDADKQRMGHEVLQANRNTYITPLDGTHYVRLGLRVYAGGSCKIHRLVLGHLDLEPANILGQSDVLLLTNHYPSYDDLYRNGFVHSRVKAYREYGVSVDIFRLRKDQPISWHEFQDIDVTTGSQQALRRMLASGRYRHILVHFLDPDMWEVLKDFIDNIKVTVWVHGADIQPWYRRKFNIETPEQEKAAIAVSEKRMVFWRALLNPMPANLQMVFVSKYFAEEVMEDLGFRLPDERYHVIHNPVDTDLFSYAEKDPEQRKKILSIRPYSSKVYANDLAVKCIEELAREPFFGELAFHIIGNGALFDETVEPLKKYTNVTIEKKFLSQYEIAALHKKYGVFLCPSRYDTQGVSRDEAISSGLVAVVSDVGAVTEFVDPELTFVVKAESYEGLASSIKCLYENPDLFVRNSRLSSAHACAKVSKKSIVSKELELF
ncbi:FkbM family methyltransferase [Pseudomonas sp. PL-6]